MLRADHLAIPAMMKSCAVFGARRALLALLIFAVNPLLQAQAPYAAELPEGFDLRAKDAVDFFAAMCVSTNGDRSKAVGALTGNPLANRLPDEVVSALQQGRTGGVAWGIQSPRKARFIIEYDPIGMCAIRLAEADEQAVRVAFKALAEASSIVANSTLKTGSPEIRHKDGATLTTIVYSYPVSGHVAQFILTTSDKVLPDQQHYMTLSFSKPEK